MGWKAPVWMIGLSLLTSVLGVSGAVTAHNDECADTAGGPGFGGIEEDDLQCTFACEASAIVAVEVESVDDDATVEGHAECADATAHCSGVMACSRTSAEESPPQVTTFHSDGGSCYGSTAENWDSAAAIACDSFSADEPDAEPCLLDCQDVAAGAPGGTGPAVTIFMAFPTAWATVCDDVACGPVTPTCSIMDLSWTCWID